jgi:glycosyltransferase involved in cell wall biosynthesis
MKNTKKSVKSTETKKIAILVVAYFAEKTIEDVLSKIPPQTVKECAEIIVQDDASTDRTTQVTEEFKKKHGWKNLTIVHNEKNLGYGGNQKKGYKHCLEKGYDCVVMLHGDAQYPPEDSPKLLAPLLAGEAEMTFGSRMTGKPLEGGMPLWKFIGNKFLTAYANFMLGMKLSEYHSGFRAYNVKALHEAGVQSCSDNFVFDTDIVIAFKKKNFRIAECTIPTHYGPESRQIRPIPVLRYGLQIMKRVTLFRLNLR